MAETRKIAISIPGDLMRRVERLRKKTGESRSAFIRRAIEGALAQKDHRALVARYQEGYIRHPETSGEITGADASAIELLSEVAWE
jgi:metal-responsive CopG/Arc/MetJ family transcriptional regulator